MDNLFLTTKHKTVYRKIKFKDCVYDVATGEARRVFRLEEKFLAYVPRGLPERVEADVADARSCV